MAVVSEYQSRSFIAVVPSSVLVTLTVENENGVPLRRTVGAYYSGSVVSAPLAVTATDENTGQATFALPGAQSTEFAFLVQGETGENHTVHCRKKPD